MRRWILFASMRRISLVLSAYVLVTGSCFAQELGTGVISGEVSDPQSAVVRNAQVTVVQKNTGLFRKTTTNASGLLP